MAVDKFGIFHVLEQFAEQRLTLCLGQAINPNGVKRIHPQCSFAGLWMGSHHGVALSIVCCIARQQGHTAPIPATGFDAFRTVGFSCAVNRTEVLQALLRGGIQTCESPYPIAIVSIATHRGNDLGVQYGRVRRGLLKRPVRVPGTAK